MGFMSAWDRRDALMKYEAMFDEAENEEELIAQLGNPTKLAIGLALNYVPSPAPESIAVEPVEEPETGEEAPAEETAPVSAEETEAGEEPCAEAEGPAMETELLEEKSPAAPVRRRKVRPFGLIVAILFGLVIGMPVALVLIVLGIPFLVSGAATVAAAVWSVLAVVPALAMISDILVVVGLGLVICGLGLLLAWFGLWLSFELGYLWIGGVVLRLGRALTYKKEVAAK